MPQLDSISLFLSYSLGILVNIIIQGIAFRDVTGRGELFPSVGMKKPGEHIRVNFGQSPFVYNIDEMILVSRNISIISLYLQLQTS